MPRAFFHDYRAPSVYHLILSKAPEAPLFGAIARRYEDPYICRSSLGNIVAANIWNISALHPALRLYKYCVMPDHAHFVVNVLERLPHALGTYIAQLKIKITQEARGVGTNEPIFKPDFYDRFLFTNDNLPQLCRYIEDNPRRLAIRLDHPDYFRKVNNFCLCGQQVQAYGNFQLLSNPLKDSVVIHRADTQALLEAKHRNWLYHAENKGVFVSPFISAPEKEVRRELEMAGARIILITDQHFPERYKPYAHDFSLCEEGRMLVISIRSPEQNLSRATCLRMNALAEAIASPFATTQAL